MVRQLLGVIQFFLILLFLVFQKTQKVSSRCVYNRNTISECLSFLPHLFKAKRDIYIQNSGDGKRARKWRDPMTFIMPTSVEYVILMSSYHHRPETKFLE